MNNPQDNTLPGKISAEGLKREARLAQLSPQITQENVHDGSETSREFARLAVEIIDEYLDAIDLLLASPLLPVLPVADREKLEGHRADFAAKRVKAQQAVDLNG